MDGEALIDESGEVPTVAGDRLTVFDVLAAMSRSEDEMREQFREWGFSAEERVAICEYVAANRERFEWLEDELLR
jgi:hypothetical protein